LASCLLELRAWSGPARPGGGEVPQAATVRSPVEGLSMGFRNGTSLVGACAVDLTEREGARWAITPVLIGRPRSTTVRCKSWASYTCRSHRSSHPYPPQRLRPSRAGKTRPDIALDSYERVRSYERQTESATPGLCSAPVLAEVAALVSHPRSPEHPHRKTAAITPSSATPAIETASVSWLPGRHARPLSRDVGQRIDLAPGQPRESIIRVWWLLAALARARRK
jgi:hypothetical protein